MEENEVIEHERTPFELLQDSWASLNADQRHEAFYALPREEAEELFLSLSPADQYELIRDLQNGQKRSWIRLLAPDDTADLIQQFPHEERAQILALLDITSMREVVALLAYAEDDAGGLMNPRFVRLRPDVSVDVAIRYIRAQSKAKIETIHYVYVLDQEQHLLGALSFRDLFLAPPDKLVSEVMKSELVTLPEDMDQEEVGRKFSQCGLSALPVVDSEGKMKGIVTVDDAVEVVQEEATEDMHKLGGTEALDEPYLQISLPRMIHKRVGWLTFLFFGEMLTATAMQFFQSEIEHAVVLALFLPLIISSGGNSGSQATSLVIRAMALREVRLRDWWRVLGRELVVGASLGLVLGLIGMIRILAWPSRHILYGEHFKMVAVTVGTTVMGVVLWGSIAGSMLPLFLRRVGFDPATSSAPFVATLVDVTGLMIYFTIASIMLHGTLL
jgi:magnesium transporter